MTQQQTPTPELMAEAERMLIEAGCYPMERKLVIESIARSLSEFKARTLEEEAKKLNDEIEERDGHCCSGLELSVRLLYDRAAQIRRDNGLEERKA